MTGRRSLVLAFFTGVGGLGSESVHLKLLDQTVGAAPTTSVLVVALFIAGVGVGAWLSRSVRAPFAVEVLLAIYYALLALSLPRVLGINASVLGALAPALGPTTSATLLGSVYVLPPAVLLGITFPMVAESSGNPARAYGWQSFGALTGLLLVDAVVFPTSGLTSCLLMLAGAHVASTMLLWPVRYTAVRSSWGEVPLRLLSVGIATGGLQAAWLVLARRLFKPFYFLTPVLLATFLVGLFLGSVLWLRLRWSFERSIRAVCVGASISVSAAAALFLLEPPASVMSMTVQLVLVVAPTAIPIGALWPAFVGAERRPRRALGAAVLALSLGNAAGLLFTAFFLLTYTNELVAIMLLLTLLAAIAFAGERRSTTITAALGIVVVVAVFCSEEVMLRRVNKGQSIESIDASFRRFGEVTGVFRYRAPRARADTTSPVFARRLHQNGYSPVVLDHNMEGVISIVGASYAKRFGRALVLGAGSGRSAGVASMIFDEVDLVDVGETSSGLLRFLRDDNFDVLARQGVRLHRCDAILAPRFLPSGYDIIIMTVDPAFVASAAKLYTVESLAAFKSLLAADGVLIFWSDGLLTLEANQVLVNTAAEVFAHQRSYSVLPVQKAASPWDYFLVANSSDELKFRPDRSAIQRVPRDRFMNAVLELDESEQVTPLKLHATKATHRFDNPSWSVLVSGYRYALSRD